MADVGNSEHRTDMDDEDAGLAQAGADEVDAEIDVEIEIDDEAPTLRRPPVFDDDSSWLGRETLNSVAVIALGIATIAYAAVGAPPQPLRALASGASVVAGSATR